MYSVGNVGVPYERELVDDTGLGFNPFKAIKRAVTFKKTSFRPKNLFGAVGSVGVNLATLGAASTFAPKMFSANSKTMQKVGMGFSAAALAAGAVVGGVVAAPVIGSALGAMGSAVAGAAGIVGKSAVGIMSGTFGRFVGSRPPHEQQLIANSITPEIIAGIDQGTIDPDMYMTALQRGLPAVSGVPSVTGGAFMVPGEQRGLSRGAIATLAGVGILSVVLLMKGK